MSIRVGAPQCAGGKLLMCQHDVIDLIYRQDGSIADLSYVGSHRRMGTRGVEQRGNEKPGLSSHFGGWLMCVWGLTCGANVVRTSVIAWS